MKISDVILEMELAGVDSAVITEIVNLQDTEDLDVEMIDEELLKRGYQKIFTVDYESDDDYDDWEEDGFVSVQKFPHKQHYKD